MNNNQEVGIFERYGGPETKTAIVPDILDCYAFRTFWITWSSNSIAIGQGGNFYEGLLLEMQTNARLHTVQALGIGSSHLTDLDYEFINIQGIEDFRQEHLESM